MDDSHQKRLTLFFTRISEFAAVLTFAMGCLVLAGWFFDIAPLKSGLPGLPTMKTNTALCFFLIGFSLWLSQEKRVSPKTRNFSRLCLLLNFAIAGLTIYEYVWGVNIGMDEFLIREDAMSVLTTSHGRMGINTAVCFVIAGIALFFLDVKTSRNYYPAQLLAAAGWSVVVLALIGYVYGGKVLFGGVAGFTAMAVHTAVTFFVIFLGIFFARPDGASASLFTRAGIGGIITRRLIPVTLMVPPLLGLLKLWAENSGVITNELGISLVAAANMAVVSGCVLSLVFLIEKIDADRRKKEESLVSDEQQLKAVNQQLRANEQQLQAANQQLRATQQQLEASNQQLRASSEQIYAANEQLRANEQSLRAEIENRKQIEAVTQKHLNELQIFYKANVGREERILELKKEIEMLKKASGERGT